MIEREPQKKRGERPFRPCGQRSIALLQCPCRMLRAVACPVENQDMFREIAVVAMCVALAGCASTGLTVGLEAYEIVTDTSSRTEPAEQQLVQLEVLKDKIFHGPRR